MHLFSLPQLSAMLALGDGAAFLLDFEQGAFGVITRRGAVPLDARLTVNDSK